jgi:hypothetical protein
MAQAMLGIINIEQDVGGRPNLCPGGWNRQDRTVEFLASLNGPSCNHSEPDGDEPNHHAQKHI